MRSNHSGRWTVLIGLDLIVATWAQIADEDHADCL